MQQDLFAKVEDTLCYVRARGYSWAALQEVNRSEHRKYLNLYIYMSAKNADFSPCDGKSLAFLMATGGYYQLKMYECGEENLKFPEVEFNTTFIDYLYSCDRREPLRELWNVLCSIHISTFAAKATKIEQRPDVAALVNYMISNTPSAAHLAEIIAPQYEVKEKNKTFEELLGVMKPMLYAKDQKAKVVNNYFRSPEVDFRSPEVDLDIDIKFRLDTIGSIKAEAIWNSAKKMLDSKDVTMIASPSWCFAARPKEVADRDIIDKLRRMNAQKRLSQERKEEKEEREFFEKLDLQSPETERLFDRKWVPRKPLEIEEMSASKDATIRIDIWNLLCVVYEHLTTRQKEVFDLLKDGCKPVEIARKLNMTESAVSQHVKAVRKKYEKEMKQWKK